MRDDLARILHAVDEDTGSGNIGQDTFSLLVRLLASTGMRIGEALALQWRHVDLERRRIRVEGTLREDDKLTVGPPKTKAALRELYVSSDLLDYLSRHRTASGTLGRSDAFVLTGEHLGPLRASLVLRRKWHPLLRRLRLQKTGFHSLRRTFASIALEEGAPPAAVAAVLGQTDQEVLLDHYSKSNPRQALGVFERVGDVLSSGDSEAHRNQ
jgi:integrase